MSNAYNDYYDTVLNLVISGMPSIRNWTYEQGARGIVRFKPCYKWNAFNTEQRRANGIRIYCFKPCYKWNAFNTLDFDKSTDFMDS